MYRCQICFDELGTNGYAASTPCGHAFCSDCLETASKRLAMCPTCREPLKLDIPLTTISATEASQIISKLSKSYPQARPELQRLAPRPIKLFLEKDEAVPIPAAGSPEERLQWQATMIAKRDADIRDLTAALAAINEEHAQETRLLTAERDFAVEECAYESQRRAEIEAHSKQNEEDFMAWCKLLGMERSVIEDRCWRQEKELIRERKDRLAAEKKVAAHDGQLKEAMATIEDLRKQLGKAADAQGDRKHKDLRRKALLQSCTEQRDQLAIEVQQLKDKLAAERGRSLPGSAYRPRQSARPERSDETLNESDEDESFDIISYAEEDDLTVPDMELVSISNKRKRDMEEFAGRRRTQKAKKVVKPIAEDARAFVGREGKWISNAALGPRRKVVAPKS